MSDVPRKLTEDLLRKQGYVVDTAESYNAISRRRKDLFGFMDSVAICPERGIIAVQSTSLKNISARIKKITTECEKQARAWLSAGGFIYVFGWGKDNAGRDTKKAVIVYLDDGDFKSMEMVRESVESD